MNRERSTDKRDFYSKILKTCFKTAVWINIYIIYHVEVFKMVANIIPLCRRTTFAWPSDQILWCQRNMYLVIGGWSSWGSWSTYSSCSSTCRTESMTYTRTRHCRNPSPRYGGSVCSGLSREFSHKRCLTQNCPGK